MDWADGSTGRIVHIGVHVDAPLPLGIAELATTAEVGNDAFGQVRAKWRVPALADMEVSLRAVDDWGLRKRFDEIVAKHGWKYKGGRDWRTRVIYDTNVLTSYAAGRWQQQAVKELRPYWRYRHSIASEHPRHLHLERDGIVLHADDP